MFKQKNKKGSIGITIVMLVFCLLMSVSMSYHKTIQTETIIQNNVNYSDRAVDAAFSGINYAMAAIQSEKKVFNTTSPMQVLFLPSEPSTDGIFIKKKSQWINLASTAKFDNYLDEDRKTENQNHPPYRFKVACDGNSYYENNGQKFVLIKSYGEYIKYDKDNNIVNTYAAQLMADCVIEPTTKTIKLKRYRRMQLQNPDELAYSSTFFSFKAGDFYADKINN